MEEVREGSLLQGMLYLGEGMKEGTEGRLGCKPTGVCVGGKLVRLRMSNILFAIAYTKPTIYIDLQNYFYNTNRLPTTKLHFI